MTSSNASSGASHAQVAGGDLVTLDDIAAAHRRIAPHIHRTPLLISQTMDRWATSALSPDPERIRIKLFFKAENLQTVGAFKIRGATNAVAAHMEQLKGAKSVVFVTHSSGNHAQALAVAANRFFAAEGASAAIVVPRTAPTAKREAVQHTYGARVVLCEPNVDARTAAAQKLEDELRQDPAVEAIRFVHPYDEPLVIAGQGTTGLEMVEQVRDLDGAGFDVVIAPVGGGGLLSGVSTAVKSLDSKTVVIGAEPELVDDAQRSFLSGKLQPAVTPTPPTACDGLLTGLSNRTLRHIQKNVDAICTATEEQILSATALTWQRMKNVIEPSAAVPLAVVLNNASFKEKVQEVISERKQGTSRADSLDIRIGIVWTGGNVDFDQLAPKLFPYFTSSSAPA